MSRFTFDLARSADDAELRRVLGAIPIDGPVAVSQRRASSYFAAAVVQGRERQVLIGRDAKTGRTAGLVWRSIMPRYLNGKPEPVGFLSNVQVLADYRSPDVVARGYASLRLLHADGKAHLYLATITDQDQTARKLLGSAEDGFPNYHYAGRFLTAAVPLVAGNAHERPDLKIRSGTLDDRRRILKFLHSAGPRRQYFPCYREEDLFTPEGVFRDLAPRDLLLAFQGDRLVGTLGGWDQHGFRQNVVHHYSVPLRWLRPVRNVWARLRGQPVLPGPGRPLRLLTAALPVVADDNPGVFSSLIDALIARRAGGPWSHLLIGLHEADPLAAILKRPKARLFISRLCVVCWSDGETLRRSLDGRPPYLELGSL